MSPIVTGFAVVAALYLLGMIALSKSRAAAHLQTLSDYFLASWRFGVFPIALSFVASWFGAASTIGSVDAYSNVGLSGMWVIAVPSVISVACIALFYARRVCLHAVRTGQLSQPEAVEAAYGPWARLLLSVVILISITTFVGSQLVALGLLLEQVFGVSMPLAVIGVASAVVLYSLLGGFAAVVMTDMAQMATFSLGLFLLVVWMLAQLLVRGWTDPLMALVSVRNADFWQVVNEAQGWPYALGLLIAFVPAWVVAPEMWQRMSAMRRPDAARASVGFVAGMLLVLLLIVAVIGLLAPGFVPALGSKGVLVQLAVQMGGTAGMFGVIAGVLVLLGILAAVTSTMDSSINVGALTLTHDLFQRFFRPQSDHDQGLKLVTISRWATVVVTIPAVIIALAYQDIIQILWMSADLYAAAMFFPITGLLYLKTPTRQSGLWAMAAGALTVLVTRLTGTPPWPYATMLGLLASGLAFWAGLSWPWGDPREREQAPLADAFERKTG